MVSDETAVAKLVAELAKQSGRSAKGWMGITQCMSWQSVVFDYHQTMVAYTIALNFNPTEEKDSHKCLKCWN